VEPLVQHRASGSIVARTKIRAVLVPAPLASVPWTERAHTRRTACPEVETVREEPAPAA
jgi:hypothetical protein